MSEVTVLSVGTLLLLFSSFNASSIVFRNKCSLQDSSCLTELTRSLLKAFVDGNAALGIEKMDEMSIEPVEIKKNGLIFEEKNIEVQGLKNSIISNVSVDLNYKSIVISSETSLVITGDYTASGFLFTLPVFGDGKSTKKLNDVKLDIMCFYDIEKNKDGNDVMNLKSHTYSASVIGGLLHHYENAFNNDKEKSDQLHTMLNDNWRIMVYNFEDFYFSKIMPKIFTGIQKLLASQNLKDIAIY